MAPTSTEDQLAASPIEPAPPQKRRRHGFLDRRLVTIGIGGGALSGLLGVGGGIVMVPLLVIWARYDQRDAHAASLGAIIPISIAGIVTYAVAGSGTIHVYEAVALAAGSIGGAVAGARLLTRTGDAHLKLVFGLFVVAAAIVMLVHL